jgi:PKD repeat protein
MLALLATPALASTPTVGLAATVLTRGPYIQATTTTSTTIVWRFDTSTTATVEYGPTLAYGSEQSSSAKTEHVVVLTGLAPGQRYYYRIRSTSNVVVEGAEYHFETAPESGGMRVMLFGDSGKGYADQFTLAALMNQYDVDLIAHTGDVVYTEGRDSRYDGRFFQPYAGLLRNTPIYPALGNHDNTSVSAWWDNFHLPANRFNPQVYSYDWGDAHFVVLDSNALDDAQAAWLEADLAATDKPWKFVYLHHPPYSCGYTPSEFELRQRIAPILDAAGVDILFNGHAHDYQRSYPILAEEITDSMTDSDYIDPEGTFYVVTGGASETRESSDDCWFTRFSSSTIHFTLMDIQDGVLDLQAIDIDGNVLDRMSITKRALAGNLPPTVNATATPSTGLAPLTVQFQATAVDPEHSALTYEWTFGDGTTSTAQNPSHVYVNPGSYNVTVTVRDDLGRGASDLLSVTATPANQPPQVAATATPNTGAAPLAVAFRANATDPDGDALTYAWNFRDGATASTANPQHTFAAVGTYDVALLVTDSRGATTNQTLRITVAANQPPQVAATATPTSGIAPLTVVFQANASDKESDALTYAWSFDDGGTASTPTAQHTFAASDGYDVVLTVTDARGATTSQTIQITVNPNQPPQVAATATPTSGMAPLSVAFQANASDPEGDALTYAWSFRDGGTASTANPQHTFAAAGTYDVALLVTDARGAVTSRTLRITANANQPPQVAATATPTSGPAPLLVRFNAGATDPEGDALTYSWSFGDGGSASTVNPERTYEDPDPYRVTLTVTDARGAATTDTLWIDVLGNQPPHVAPTATPSTGLAPLLVQFSAGASDPEGEALTYRWTFGDGGTATTPNPQHLYEDPDPYTVTLTVTDARGASTTANLAVVAYVVPPNQPPRVAPSAVPMAGIAPLRVAFNAGATDPEGEPLMVRWRLGTTILSALPTFEHTFNDAGTYNVELLVLDRSGGSAEATLSIVVTANTPPQLSARALPESGRAPHTATFAAGAFDPEGEPLALVWQFGDGTTSTATAPQHTFTLAGTYYVTVTATDPRGASASDVVRVVVQPPNLPPTVVITAWDSTGVVPFMASLQSYPHDPEGEPVTYLWTFPDGTASTTQCATKHFGFPGTYDVMVEVTDPHGASGRDTLTVTVLPNQPPQVAPFATPAVGPAPLDVVVDAGASDAEGDSLSYHWSFGDGTQSNQRRPTHRYTAAGEYAVIVTVSDTRGGWNRAMIGVRVTPNDPPIISATATPLEGTAPLTVDLVATTIDPEGEPVSVRWVVADGPTLIGDNVTHDFLDIGSYKLKVTATDPHGAWSSKTFLVKVSPNQEPQITVDTAPRVCVRDEAVVFTATAVDPEGGPLVYLWDFGDGSYSSTQNPTHVYPDVGRFEATLTVSDARGGESRTVIPVLVVPDEELGIKASPWVARFNFQPHAFDVPAGYLADDGGAYTDARGYGWSRSVETDQVFATDDLRRNTFARIPNDETATWLLDLENGSYLVTLVAGSPSGRAQHRITMQGAVVVDAAPTGPNQFVVIADRPVVVRDRKLRLQLGNLRGSPLATQLCFVDIAAASPTTQVLGSERPHIRLVSNPSPSAAISMRLTDAARVQVDIFDVRGRLVRRLHDGVLPVGDQAILWNGTDGANRNVESGIYLVRTLVGRERHVFKVAIAR